MSMTTVKDLAQVIKKQAQGKEQGRGRPRVRGELTREEAIMIDADGDTCPICAGLGFVVPDVEPGDPAFGRAVPCACQQAIIAGRLWQHSGLLIAERAWRLSFIEDRPGKVWAYKAARAILDDDRPSGWLILYGPYGVGKSGVLKAAVAELIDRGVKACYRRAEDILAEARATFDDDDQGQESALGVRDKYAKIPLLAIDEVDRVSMTDWARSFLFTLLDERYNRRDQVATLLATNAKIGDMGPEWGYLESRMADGMVVAMAGDSLRDKLED